MGARGWTSPGWVPENEQRISSLPVPIISSDDNYDFACLLDHDLILPFPILEQPPHFNNPEPHLSSCRPA